MARWTIRSAALAVSTLLLAVTPAFADEAGIEVSGFVDVSASFSSNLDFSDPAAAITFDQAEVDLAKSWDRVGLRMDLNVLPGMEAQDLVEQAFVTVSASERVGLTVGRFNAPIGWELLDPNDMYQISHAMVFDFGLPSNLTGIMAAIDMSPVDVALYVANNWDAYLEPDLGKTAGTRIGISPTDSFNAGLSAIYNHPGDEDPGVLVFDVDVTLKTESFLLGGELNLGSGQSMKGDPLAFTSSWLGGLVTLNVPLTDAIGLTLRGDFFVDAADAGDDATRTGLQATYVTGTVSPSFSIADNAGVLIEYALRVTMPDGGDAQLSHVLAAEATFVF